MKIGISNCKKKLKPEIKINKSINRIEIMIPHSTYL